MTDLLTYTPAQAAEVLQISERQVRRLISARELPFTRLGDRLLIPRSALATFLDAQAMATVVEQAVQDRITGVTMLPSSRQRRTRGGA